MTSFPTTETVESFVSILKRDGIVKYTAEQTAKKIKKEYKPSLDFLNDVINNYVDDDIDEGTLFVGFWLCFSIFKNQIEANEMKDEDLAVMLSQKESYIEFLEEEIRELKQQNNSV